MENATKALIMAGTVLISILLISFLVLFLRKGASASAEYHNTMSDAELAKFNSQFEVYDGRENNTYFDVITVANMVYDINKKNENDIQNQIYFELKIDNSNIYTIPKDCSNLERDTFLLVNSKKNMYNTQITIAGKQTTLISEYSKITENSPIDYVYKFTGKITKYNDITGKVEEIKFTKK